MIQKPVCVVFECEFVSSVSSKNGDVYSLTACFSCHTGDHDLRSICLFFGAEIHSSLE